MIYLLNAPFILDLFATLSLLILCFLVVVGVKAVMIHLSFLFPKKPKPVEAPKTPKTHAKKPVKRNAKPIRSIEINPEEVDRIYVKKIS